MKFRHALQYTEDDLTLLNRMFGEYYSIKDIATALHRSPASVLQRIHNLGLKRDHKLVRLVEAYGPEVLAIAGDPVAIKELANSQRGDERRRRRSARDMGKKAILVKMKVDMAAGVDYTRAMKIAHDAGVSVKLIAEALGVTIWHVQGKVAPRARAKASLPCNWP